MVFLYGYLTVVWSLWTWALKHPKGLVRMSLGEMAQISQWGETACRHTVWGMIVDVMIWEWWVVVHEEWGACMMRCCDRSLTEDCR
jgi:hypothetical protein